jgi:hypothetical protein
MTEGEGPFQSHVRRPRLIPSAHDSAPLLNDFYLRHVVPVGHSTDDWEAARAITTLLHGTGVT